MNITTTLILEYPIPFNHFLPDTHRSRIEFFRRIYEDDKQAVLSEWEQDSARFKEMHALKQQQLECVFYQLEETTDGGIRNNHERFLDRCEDLKSGVSFWV